MTTWKTVLTFLSEYQYFSSKNSKIRHKSKWLFLHACYGCVSRHHIRDTYCRFQISYWHLSEAIVLEWTGYNWWTQKIPYYLLYVNSICLYKMFSISSFMDFKYYMKTQYEPRRTYCWDERKNRCPWKQMERLHNIINILLTRVHHPIITILLSVNNP